MTTIAFRCAPRPRLLPLSLPPTNVSSTSTPSAQPVPTWPDHRPSQLVQPGPCRLIAPQPQDALQSQNAGAVLLAGYEPDGQKPGPQRGPRSLEYRPRHDRDLFATISAMQVPPLRYPRLLEAPTSRTPVPSWPAQCHQIGAAGGLFVEESLELVECPRVVDATPGPTRHAHAHGH